MGGRAAEGLLPTRVHTRGRLLQTARPNAPRRFKRHHKGHTTTTAHGTASRQQNPTTDRLKPPESALRGKTTHGGRRPQVLSAAAEDRGRARTADNTTETKEGLDETGTRENRPRQERRPTQYHTQLSQATNRELAHPHAGKTRTRKRTSSAQKERQQWGPRAKRHVSPPKDERHQRPPFPGGQGSTRLKRSTIPEDSS